MDMDELQGVNVNMELKGLDIEEVDYHGIKQLLMPLLPSSGINLGKFEFKYIKDSPDPSHFIFEIHVGKRRIRHRTNLNLNDAIFNRF